MWEVQQKINDKPIEKCPKCKEDTAKRLISGGSGFVLKGSGWFNSGGY
jgi:putative FmdB family regulatory protein